MFGNRLSSMFNSHEEENNKKCTSTKQDQHQNGKPGNVAHASLHSNMKIASDDTHSLLSVTSSNQNNTDSSNFLTPYASDFIEKEPTKKPRRKPPPDLADHIEYKKSQESEKIIRVEPEIDSDIQAKTVSKGMSLENAKNDNFDFDIYKPLDSENQTKDSQLPLSNRILMQDNSSFREANEDLENTRSDYLSSGYDSDKPKYFSPKIDLEGEYIQQSTVPKGEKSLYVHGSDISESSSFKNNTKSINAEHTGNYSERVYPISSSVTPSPSSSKFHHDITCDSLSSENDYTSIPIIDHESLNTPTTPTIDNSEYSLKSIDTFESNQSLQNLTKIGSYSVPKSTASSLLSRPVSGSLPQASKSSQFNTRIPLKSFKSAPFSTGSNTDSNDPMDYSRSISLTSVPTHTKSISLSSILSSPSNKNMNLSTLKQSLNLKPGEGEPSKYVMSIRKSAGTAYNESGPGKWKLPTGILPVDKKAAFTGSNGKYLRLAGGISQGRSKKSSGVELKHGHLQRRLLATEVDGTDEIIIANSSQIAKSSAASSKTIQSSNSSIINPSSITTSILRNDSFVKGYGDSQSMFTSTESSSISSVKRTSSVSSSSGSISDSNMGLGYYQHPGYKYEDGNIDENDSFELTEQLTLRNEFDEPEEVAVLHIANPDSDNE